MNIALFFLFQKSSYIASLLHILSGVFSERPPVYAKSESQATHSRPVTQQAEQARSNSTPPKPEVQPQGWYTLILQKTHDKPLKDGKKT